MPSPSASFSGFMESELVKQGKDNLLFNKIVNDLTSRGLIPKSYPFLTSTALVLASKGYAYRHILTLARPLLINVPPPSRIPSKCSQHTPDKLKNTLLSIESYAVKYEDLHKLPSTPIARYIRRSLVQLFLEKGWLGESIDLLLQERKFKFDDEIYWMVVQRMNKTERKKRREEVVKRWEKDTGKVLNRALSN